MDVCQGISSRMTCLLIWLTVAGIASASLQAEQALRDRLLQHYDKRTLPSENHNVSISRFRVLNIGMHEEKHTATVHAWLVHSWTDPRLNWSLEDNMDVASLTMDPEDIWTPDLTIYDSADSKHLPIRSHLPIIVYPNGEIVLTASVNLPFTCVMDLTYWPHDTHSCSFEIGSWVHYGQQLNLQLDVKEVEVELRQRALASGQNISTTEWNIDSMTLRKSANEHFCCPEKYVSIVAILRVTRNAPAFAWTVKMPVACLSLLTLAVFLVPPSSGEKLTFAGICLLLDSVFIGYCTYIVGSSPTHIPLILLLVCQEYLLLVLSILVAAVVLRMSKGPHTHPIPSVVKGPLLTVSYFLCLKSYRNLVAKSYQGFALYQKQDELEIGEDNTHGSCGRGSSDAHEWLLLAAVVDRIALLVYAAICFVALIRFSCVL